MKVLGRHLSPKFIDFYAHCNIDLVHNKLVLNIWEYFKIYFNENYIILKKFDCGLVEKRSEEQHKSDTLK